MRRLIEGAHNRNDLTNLTAPNSQSRAFFVSFTSVSVGIQKATRRLSLVFKASAPGQPVEWIVLSKSPFNRRKEHVVSDRLEDFESAARHADGRAGEQAALDETLRDESIS